MPRCGNSGKPKAGFPLFPQRLEIAIAIPTFPPRRRRVEKCKTKSRFRTFPLVVLYLFPRIRASPYAIIQSRWVRLSASKCYLCRRSKVLPMSPAIHLSQAIQIGIVRGASVLDRDLRVPRRLSLVVIHGRIQNADGKPPVAQDHPQVRIKEPGLQGQIEREIIKIDADGRFQFELCEGIKYSGFAFSGPISSATYSAPIEFKPTKERDQLVLVLDKTPEEFLKLRPHQ